jgi:pyrimidine-specific ribonucleoside hydrolase
MNDGLQVSTGATLGHGLIRVWEQSGNAPAAAFSFRNRWIEVRLKEAYQDQIRLDIEKAIHQFGNLTTDYWQRIRELAIRYWLEWDRYELFTIHELR